MNYSVLKALKEAPLWPLIVGVIIVLFSLVLLFSVEPQVLWSKLIVAGIAEIGFAFLISYILTISVEHKARAEMIENDIKSNDRHEESFRRRESRLSKNIFDYIYGVKVDRYLFGFIEKTIFKSPFYREGTDLYYEFVEEKDGWVLIRMEFDCKVINQTNEPMDYNFEYFVERPIFSNVPVFSKSLGIANFFLGRDYSEDEIRLGDESAADDDFFYRYRFCEKIPSDRPVGLRLVAYMPRQKQDAELWRSTVACDGLKIKIRFDSSKFDVKLLPVHSGDGFARNEREGDHVYAEISEPLLPRNGIYFWWNEKGKAA